MNRFGIPKSCRYGRKELICWDNDLRLYVEYKNKQAKHHCINQINNHHFEENKPFNKYGEYLTIAQQTVREINRGKILEARTL